MAFWPFSSDYVLMPGRVFEAITRRYWEDDFWRHNLVAVAKEIAILGPVALASYMLRRGRGDSLTVSPSRHDR